MLDSSVVLPLPVPPLTRNADRDRMIARSSSSAPLRRVLAASRSATENACAVNVRSDTHVPPGATGGSTACSRVPSGSAAST
jgi:hypothetical protein